MHFATDRRTKERWGRGEWEYAKFEKFYYTTNFFFYSVELAPNCRFAPVQKHLIPASSRP